MAKYQVQDSQFVRQTDRPISIYIVIYLTITSTIPNPSLPVVGGGDSRHPILKKCQLSSSQFELLLLVLMIAYGFLCTVLVDIGGSTHLLGSFVGGLGFASVSGASKIWEERVVPGISNEVDIYIYIYLQVLFNSILLYFILLYPPVRTWLSSLFFASIGFRIPVKSIFEPKGISSLMYFIIYSSSDYIPLPQVYSMD